MRACRGCSEGCEGYLRDVTQRGHEGLHHGELRVEAEAEQHREEEDREDGGARHGREGFRVDDEGESGAALHHLVDPLAGEVRHVAEYREDHHAGQEGGAAVDEGHEPRVAHLVRRRLRLRGEGEDRGSAWRQTSPKPSPNARRTKLCPGSLYEAKATSVPPPTPQL